MQHRPPDSNYSCQLKRPFNGRFGTYGCQEDTNESQALDLLFDPDFDSCLLVGRLFVRPVLCQIYARLEHFVVRGMYSIDVQKNQVVAWRGSRRKSAPEVVSKTIVERWSVENVS